jgi:hypothetical protein
MLAVAHPYTLDFTSTAKKSSMFEGLSQVRRLHPVCFVGPPCALLAAGCCLLPAGSRVFQLSLGCRYGAGQGCAL